MKARQAILLEPYKVGVREVELPSPAANQILVAAEFSAVSAGTELAVYPGMGIGETPESHAVALRLGNAYADDGVVNGFLDVEPHLRRSRHIPDAIKRAVYERDGGRCTFTDDRGCRCAQAGGLEFDHLDGFARTHLHDADRIRLLCRAHNQHAAEATYGRDFMERARSRVSTCPWTGRGALEAATSSCPHPTSDNQRVSGPA